MRQTHFCPHGIFSISMFSSPSDKRCYKNAFTRCPPASWRQYSAVQCPECGWEQGKISLFSSTWWLQQWAQEAGLGGGAGEILWAAAGPIRPPVSAIKCLFYCKGLSNKCVSWFWLVVAQDPEKLSIYCGYIHRFYGVTGRLDISYSLNLNKGNHDNWQNVECNIKCFHQHEIDWMVPVFVQSKWLS